MGSRDNSCPNNKYRCSYRFKTWSIQTSPVLTSKVFMAFDLYLSKVIVSSGTTHQR